MSTSTIDKQIKRPVWWVTEQLAGHEAGESIDLLAHIDRMTIHENLLWCPTITIYTDSLVWIVNVIEVPTCTVMAGGIDASGVGLITGGGITWVNPEGVSLARTIHEIDGISLDLWFHSKFFLL